MNREMGGKASDFARLFMVPNMAHCGGGPATNDFPPNELNAITAWVENGTAPARIVATNHNTSFCKLPTGDCSIFASHKISRPTEPVPFVPIRKFQSTRVLA